MTIRKERFDLRSLAQRVLSSIFALAIVSSLSKEVKASSGYYTVELEVFGQLNYEDVMSRAEQLVSTEIVRQFNTQPELTELQVVVLAQRFGEVVPILSAQVSRQQWIASPQVSNWVRYYSAAYALLHRSDEDGELAAVPASAVAMAPRISEYQQSVMQVETAFSQGRLSRDEYQNLIDALD